MTGSVSSFDLPSMTNDGIARSESIANLSVDIPTTPVVGYTSLGRVLAIGDPITVQSVKKKLKDSDIACFTLAVTSSNHQSDEIERAVAIANFKTEYYLIFGHLGSFQVLAVENEIKSNLGELAGIESGYFDIVLELSKTPSITAAIPPPGYYWLSSENSSNIQIQQTLTEIPELVGNFEKPKFFNYNPDICAHSRSGIIACTRCIDACPTDAIKSINSQIEVDSHLCQGGGSCSTACPTGAITYTYPPAENMQEILRQLISNYLKAGGKNPVVLFYDSDKGSAAIEPHVSSMNENLLPVAVEEIGSVGLDVLLSMLAYGVKGAKLVCTDATKPVISELKQQIEIADRLLDGLGYGANRIELIETEITATELNRSLNIDVHDQINAATYMPAGSKRTDMRTALEHLHQNSNTRPFAISLPAHAPFGKIEVDSNTCTLCMGCVSVCPASALEAGGDTPKLSLIENNCVQCGLCMSACPEDSINLVPRYLFDSYERLRSKLLNEDSPFNCRICGKPFATNAVITRMKDKLKDHWMFAQKPESIARLELCEECRVKDMFAAEGGFPRDKI